MGKKLSVGVLLGATVAIAAVVAGYAGGAKSATSATPLPSSSCGPVVYKGSGSPDFIVASDLPMQGAIRHQTVQVSRAEIWALANAGWKAGPYKIGYQSCDDSTAQTGGWDSGKCATNARLYALNKSVIGVIGTFNSGCAKIVVPILNRANPGPVAMVSPANTYLGLTKKWIRVSRRSTTRQACATTRVSWRRTTSRAPRTRCGRRRRASRRSTSSTTADLRLRRRDDLRERGEEARHHGRRLPGWDAKQSSYEALANAIKKSGAQVVFLGGIVCNNGAKLMKDIKSVNPRIKLLMPDGFSDPGANGSVANGIFISVGGQPPTGLVGCRRDLREVASASRSTPSRTRTPPTAHRRWTSC